MQALQPFSPTELSLRVRGELVTEGKLLTFRFELDDPAQAVLDSPIPGSGEPVRADDLWKTTCFEAFWGEQGKPGYWELNLSGRHRRWNLYSFDSYRAPSPPRWCHDFALERWDSTTRRVECALRGERELRAPEASLCVILRTAAGNLYFSTRHAGARADFHLRESFLPVSG